MKTFTKALVFWVLSPFCFADLSPMDSGALDSYLADFPTEEGRAFRHSYQLRANFDLGSQYGRLSDCRNNKPRKEQSFYPCWNHQSKVFFKKLGYTLKHQAKDVIPTEFRFNLSRSGRLTDIQVFGVQDEPTKRQLIGLLKDMEFGYSYKANTEPLVLSVDTRKVAGN